MKFIRPLILTISLSVLATSAFATTKHHHHHHHQHSKNKTISYEQKVKDSMQASNNQFGIGLYRQNYVLPVFYTASPDREQYRGRTPGDQELDKKDVKGQISFQMPIAQHLFHKNLDLIAAYTQKFYWQFYQDSAFFRETNYEPEIFVQQKLKGISKDNISFINWGVEHQSNGQGGTYERSWNRAYVDYHLAGDHWYVSVKPWLSVFRGSTQRYNSDITHYLGYERVLFAYKQNKLVYSLMLRNSIESGFKRYGAEATMSFPLFNHFRGFIQAFNGYGQSLIEYNHRTSAVGIGVAINDLL